VSNDVDCHLNILLDLANFLNCDEYEETRILILKLLAFFDDKFSTYYNIDKLVKCKYYFSGYQVEQMLENFNEIKRESDCSTINRKSFNNYLLQMNSRVKKFASLLKKKIQAKRAKKKEKRAETVNFKHQETNLMVTTFSIDEIYSFTSICLMIKFPISVPDKEITQYLTDYINKAAK
jgi:hypothetical protein